MSEYAVDKGVSVTPSDNRTRFPWRQMEVGDSFFVPLPLSQEDGDKYLRSSIYNAGRSSLNTRGLLVSDGYNIVVRKVTENGTVGLRAWMTKE